MIVGIMRWEQGAKCCSAPCSRVALLTQVQLLDDRAVTLDIDLLQVAQKVSSVTNHLQHAAAAVMVLVVGLEVLGQRVDAMGKDRDLNLGGTGVALMGGVLRNNGLLFFFQHGFIHLSVYYAQPQRQVGECHVVAVSCDRESVMHEIL